jgi:NhaP-type Na+/H+ or K+/H+ antiporter
VHDFETALAVLGGLLVVGALLSSLAKRSFLSLTALFVMAGFLLGDGALEVLHFDPTSGFVTQLALVALIVILFRDGLEVDREMLPAWRLPLRKLVFAMPLTAAIVALITHTVTDLDWTQSFLVGALLSPTDPVLSSSVVTNPRVPATIRHSLNLESGLNDGLALPFVLALVAALNESDFNPVTFVLQDVGLGLAFGIGIGLLASLYVPSDGPGRSLYALGTGFFAYGSTVLPPHGNGVIAVFVCAIVLGVRRPEIREAFVRRADDLIEIIKLGVFVVFGSLLTFDSLFGDGWAAVAIVVVLFAIARPASVWIALTGSRTPWDTKAFMAWFGPKGVATMTFSILVLGADVPGAERIFDLCALAVFCSILLHGLTDHPGAEWMARRAEAREAASREARPAPAR